MKILRSIKMIVALVLTLTFIALVPLQTAAAADIPVENHGIVDVFECFGYLIHKFIDKTADNDVLVAFILIERKTALYQVQHSRLHQNGAGIIHQHGDDHFLQTRRIETAAVLRYIFEPVMGAADA